MRTIGIATRLELYNRRSMFDLCLCYAPQDSEIAIAIQSRLALDPRTRVTLAPSGRLIEGWEEGLSSAALLLLLSDSSIPERLPRKDWDPLLRHAMGKDASRVGCLLAGDCPYPPLLARNNFWRWSDGPREALRAIERWVVSLHDQIWPDSFVPARLPWFEGCARVIDRLWETLVDGQGTVLLTHPGPGSGKTSLAQHFARNALAHFHAVVWVDCSSRSEAALLSDLASQLGIPLDRPMDELHTGVCRALNQARLLLVMDDVHPAAFPSYLYRVCFGSADFAERWIRL